MKFRISNEEFFFCSKHNFLRFSVKPNRRGDRIRFVARLRMLIRCRCSENKQQQDPEKPKGGLPCPEKLTGTAKHPQERGGAIKEVCLVCFWVKVRGASLYGEMGPDEAVCQMTR